MDDLSVRVELQGFNNEFKLCKNCWDDQRLESDAIFDSKSSVIKCMLLTRVTSYCAAKISHQFTSFLMSPVVILMF